MVVEERQLATSLEKAKEASLLASQGAAQGSQWEKSQTYLRWAESIDSMLAALRNMAGGASDGVRAAPVGPPSAPARAKKLPYFYVDGDGKLVKIGPSRDGSTYEHRVTRPNYTLMIDVLSELARQAKVFETTEFVTRCDIPRHEPLIVLTVLEQRGLVMNVRKGKWAFVNASTFAEQAEQVWTSLPRE